MLHTASRLIRCFPVAVLCAAAILGGCSRSTKQMVALDASEATDSHRRMIEVLADVAKDAAWTNEYFNSGSQIESSRRALSDAISRDDVVAQLEAHKTVGLLELNAGNSALAAEHLKTASELVPVIRQRQLARISDAAEETLLLQTAVAFLRQGEDENCVHCTDGSACILPFAEEAIHQQRTGSEQAMRFLRQTLDVNPKSASAIWLLNLAAMTLGEYPEGVPESFRIPPERFSSGVDFPKFKNIANDLGLDTLSHSGGAIVDDFDGDHLLDIVVSNWDPSGQIQFFRHRGDGSFDRQTERANLIGITGGLNIVQADYDNDGDLDIYVMRGAWMPDDVGSTYPNSLLQNDGSGRFIDVTFAVGLGDRHVGTQTAAWSDFDLDGDLDLYVGSETSRCQLFRNDNGRFVDVAETAGVADARGVVKAVAWGDFDADRWPDLYVSNLHQDNVLFRNNKDGTFTAVSRRAGVTQPRDSFASWFWDFDNDGDLDLFVASYAVGVEYIGRDYLGTGNVTESDCLYENLGDGSFREVGKEKGLHTVTQPMGSNFGDLDNDGWLDFYLGTGYPGYDGLMPNVMYHNLGGETFEDVTFSGGFGHLQKGHGVAFADLDDDGDQDVFTELGGAYQGDAFHDALFENPGFGNNWLKIRLVGTESNRSAIGTRIKLSIRDGGQQRTLYRWVTSGSSFGGNPLRQEIGLGKAETVDALEIYWPKSDQTQTFTNVEANQFIKITEGNSEYEAP